MIAEQGQLLAPNGKPSKLNRVQWAQVRTDNFKAWFGDWENDPKNASKVVDSNGEPMVVYHGTPNGGFTEFSESKKGTRTSHAAEDVGFHFTDSVEYADTYSLGYRLKTIEAYRSIFGEEPKAVKMPDGSSIYPVFLNIVNPVDVGASKLINAKLISQSQNKGHDGIVADIGGDNEFVAFDPTQIKSAMGNNGEFNPTNPDIRFSQKNNEQSLAPLNPVNTRNILDRLLRGFTTKANAVRDSAVLRIRVDKSFSNLPLAIQEEAKKQGSDGNDIKGVFHNNTLGKSGAPNQWDCIYRRLG